MKINKNIIFENLKTIFYALIIALLIRSIIIQPFYIPSSSMEPNLLIGDRLFVTKFSYGYSNHSLPFSPPLLKGRIFFKQPERGDVVVFKTPSDNRTDYIKRLVGLPGDTIQFIDGNLFVNSNQVLKTKISEEFKIFCGSSDQIEVDSYMEKLSKKKSHVAVYRKEYGFKNSDKFTVPDKNYFFLGDNRDCSKDSRFLSSVGYVHEDNLVGKAQLIFFSSDYRIASIFNFFKWNETIRIDRFFKKIN